MPFYFSNWFGFGRIRLLAAEITKTSDKSEYLGFDLRDLQQESSLNDVQAGQPECMPFDGEKGFDAS
jgi:hypothetical protein